MSCTPGLSGCGMSSKCASLAHRRTSAKAYRICASPWARLYNFFSTSSFDKIRSCLSSISPKVMVSCVRSCILRMLKSSVQWDEVKPSPRTNLNTGAVRAYWSSFVRTSMTTELFAKERNLAGHALTKSSKRYSFARNDIHGYLAKSDNSCWNDESIYHIVTYSSTFCVSYSMWCVSKSSISKYAHCFLYYSPASRSTRSSYAFCLTNYNALVAFKSCGLSSYHWFAKRYTFLSHFCTSTCTDYLS